MSGQVLTQWSSILSSTTSLSPGHCVARNPGACVVSGQGVDPVVLDPFHHLPQSWPLCCTKPWSLCGVWARCWSSGPRSFPPPSSVLAIVLHETLEPAWCLGKVLTQFLDPFHHLPQSWPLCCTKPWSLRGVWASVDPVVLDPFHHLPQSWPLCCTKPWSLRGVWASVDPVVLDPFLHHLPQSWPLCCTKPWSLRGVWASVDPVVLDPFLHHLPQSWPLCCTKPWSLRGVWARC